MVQMFADSGFKLIELDYEHAPFGVETLARQIMTARNFGILPVVSVTYSQGFLIPTLLEAGAEGIVFPMVRTVAEAKEAVRAVKYPPLGVRAMTPRSPAMRFGSRSICTADQALVILMIETREAIERIDELASVEGVDILAVGPHDLAYNLGVPGRYDDKAVEDALQAVTRACRAHSKVGAMNTLGEIARAQRYFNMGFTVLFHSSDVGAVLSLRKDVDRIEGLGKRTT